MDTGSVAYRRAFEAYIRKGVPIDLSVKKARPTTHYIWRTRGDSKVRPSHAANDGKIFAWDDPPPTGHPGEDFGCRCRAEAYLPEVAEFFNITFQNVADTGRPWESSDFIEHYFFGNGKTVTVREIGHLRSIVAGFRREAIDDATRLPGQIADAARKQEGQSFRDTFENIYHLRDDQFEIGDTTIKGEFSGTSEERNGFLEISGSCEFHLRDEYRDPLDIASTLDKIRKKYGLHVADLLSEFRLFLRDRGNRITDAIGDFERYVNERTLRDLPRRGAGLDDLDIKQIGEIPFSQFYDIEDDWSGVYTARVLKDAAKSKITRQE